MGGRTQNRTPGSNRVGHKGEYWGATGGAGVRLPWAGPAGQREAEGGGQGRVAAKHGANIVAGAEIIVIKDK